jgi:hypothetical protein
VQELVIPVCVGPGGVGDALVVVVEVVVDLDIPTQYASPSQRLVQSLPIAGFQA